MHGSTGRSGYPSDSSRCRWSWGRMLTVRQVPAGVVAPAALIAPSPGRRRRPTRSGDPSGSWAASPTLQRSVGPELPHRLGGPVLARCHRRPGPLSPPLAAGRSPTASVGAWGQRPSPHVADRSLTAPFGAWDRSPSPPASGRSPIAISRRPGPESRATAAGRSPPAPPVTQPQPRRSTRARARQLPMASGDQATHRPSRTVVPATEPQHLGRGPAAND